MADAEQNPRGCFLFHSLYVLTLSEIRKRTKEAIRTAGPGCRPVSFKKRTVRKLRYDKTSVRRIFLFFQTYRLLDIDAFALHNKSRLRGVKFRRFGSVPSRLFIIIKKLPDLGSLAHFAYLWHKLRIYSRFKMTFAEKIPFSAVKSYIPSYLLMVAITELMPMPW